MDVDQSAPKLGGALFLRRGEAHLGHRNLQLVRDQPDGFGEGDVLDLLHEAEDVAGRAAAEAMKELPRSVYRHRGRFFLMEWAEPDEVLRTRLAQGDVLAHNADDVSLLLEGVRKIPGIRHFN